MATGTQTGITESSAKSISTKSPSFLETPSGRKIAYDQQSGSSPGVVYLHGLCSNMTSLRGERLAKYCQETGMSYLRFDLPGHGRSSEALEQCTISSWLDDVKDVLEALTQGPEIIVGDGLGGWLMFLYTMRNPDRIFGLVGVAPAVDFTQRLWKGLDKDTRKEVRRLGKYPFPSPVGGDPVVLSLETIVDGEKHSILDMPGIELIKSPTWILHGADDVLVSPLHSVSLMQSMQCPIELKVIEGGDHMLNRPEELELLLKAIDSLLLLKKDRIAGDDEVNDVIDDDDD